MTNRFHQDSSLDRTSRLKEAQRRRAGYLADLRKRDQDQQRCRRHMRLKEHDDDDKNERSDALLHDILEASVDDDERERDEGFWSLRDDCAVRSACGTRASTAGSDPSLPYGTRSSRRFHRSSTRALFPTRPSSTPGTVTTGRATSPKRPRGHASPPKENRQAANERAARVYSAGAKHRRTQQWILFSRRERVSKSPPPWDDRVSWASAAEQRRRRLSPRENGRHPLPWPLDESGVQGVGQAFSDVPGGRSVGEPRRPVRPITGGRPSKSFSRPISAFAGRWDADESFPDKPENRFSDSCDVPPDSVSSTDGCFVGSSTATPQAAITQNLAPSKARACSAPVGGLRRPETADETPAMQRARQAELQRLAVEKKELEAQLAEVKQLLRARHMHPKVAVRGMLGASIGSGSPRKPNDEKSPKRSGKKRRRNKEKQGLASIARSTKDIETAERRDSNNARNEQSVGNGGENRTEATMDRPSGHASSGRAPQREKGTHLRRRRRRRGRNGGRDRSETRKRQHQSTGEQMLSPDNVNNRWMLEATSRTLVALNAGASMERPATAMDLGQNYRSLRGNDADTGGGGMKKALQGSHHASRRTRSAPRRPVGRIQWNQPACDNMETVGMDPRGVTHNVRGEERVSLENRSPFSTIHSQRARAGVGRPNMSISQDDDGRLNFLSEFSGNGLWISGGTKSVSKGQEDRSETARLRLLKQEGLHALTSATFSDDRQSSTEGLHTSSKGDFEVIYSGGGWYEPDFHPEEASDKQLHEQSEVVETRSGRIHRGQQWSSPEKRKAWRGRGSEMGREDDTLSGGEGSYDEWCGNDIDNSSLQVGEKWDDGRNEISSAASIVGGAATWREWNQPDDEVCVFALQDRCDPSVPETSARNSHHEDNNNSVFNRILVDDCGSASVPCAEGDTPTTGPSISGNGQTEIDVDQVCSSEGQPIHTRGCHSFQASPQILNVCDHDKPELEAEVAEEGRKSPASLSDGGVSLYNILQSSRDSSYSDETWSLESRDRGDDDATMRVALKLATAKTTARSLFRTLGAFSREGSKNRRHSAALGSSSDGSSLYDVGSPSDSDDVSLSRMDKSPQSTPGNGNEFVEISANRDSPARVEFHSFTEENVRRIGPLLEAEMFSPIENFEGTTAEAPAVHGAKKEQLQVTEPSQGHLVVGGERFPGALGVENNPRDGARPDGRSLADLTGVVIDNKIKTGRSRHEKPPGKASSLEDGEEERGSRPPPYSGFVEEQAGHNLEARSVTDPKYIVEQEDYRDDSFDEASVIIEPHRALLREERLGEGCERTSDNERKTKKANTKAQGTPSVAGGSAGKGGRTTPDRKKDELNGRKSSDVMPQKVFTFKNVSCDQTNPNPTENKLRAKGELDGVDEVESVGSLLSPSQEYQTRQRQSACRLSGGEGNTSQDEDLTGDGRSTRPGLEQFAEESRVEREEPLDGLLSLDMQTGTDHGGSTAGLVGGGGESSVNRYLNGGRERTHVDQGRLAEDSLIAQDEESLDKLSSLTKRTLTDRGVSASCLLGGGRESSVDKLLKEGGKGTKVDQGNQGKQSSSQGNGGLLAVDSQIEGGGSLDELSPVYEQAGTDREESAIGRLDEQGEPSVKKISNGGGEATQVDQGRLAAGNLIEGEESLDELSSLDRQSLTNRGELATGLLDGGDDTPTDEQVIGGAEGPQAGHRVFEDRQVEGEESLDELSPLYRHIGAQRGELANSLLHGEEVELADERLNGGGEAIQADQGQLAEDRQGGGEGSLDELSSLGRQTGADWEESGTGLLVERRGKPTDEHLIKSGEGPRADEGRFAEESRIEGEESLDQLSSLDMPNLMGRGEPVTGLLGGGWVEPTDERLNGEEEVTQVEQGRFAEDRQVQGEESLDELSSLDKETWTARDDFSTVLLGVREGKPTSEPLNGGGEATQVDQRRLAEGNQTEGEQALNELSSLDKLTGADRGEPATGLLSKEGADITDEHLNEGWKATQRGRGPFAKGIRIEGLDSLDELSPFDRQSLTDQGEPATGLLSGGGVKLRDERLGGGGRATNVVRGRFAQHRQVEGEESLDELSSLDMNTGTDRGESDTHLLVERRGNPFVEHLNEGRESPQADQGLFVKNNGIKGEASLDELSSLEMETGDDRGEPASRLLGGRGGKSADKHLNGEGEATQPVQGRLTEDNQVKDEESPDELSSLDKLTETERGALATDLLRVGGEKIIDDNLNEGGEASQGEWGSFAAGSRIEVEDSLDDLSPFDRMNLTERGEPATDLLGGGGVRSVDERLSGGEGGTQTERMHFAEDNQVEGGESLDELSLLGKQTGRDREEVASSLLGGGGKSSIDEPLNGGGEGTQAGQEGFAEDNRIEGEDSLDELSSLDRQTEADGGEYPTGLLGGGRSSVDESFNGGGEDPQSGLGWVVEDRQFEGEESLDELTSLDKQPGTDRGEFATRLVGGGEEPSANAFLNDGGEAIQTGHGIFEDSQVEGEESFDELWSLDEQTGTDRGESATGLAGGREESSIDELLIDGGRGPQANHGRFAEDNRIEREKSLDELSPHDEQTRTDGRGSTSGLLSGGGEKTKDEQVNESVIGTQVDQGTHAGHARFVQESEVVGEDSPAKFSPPCKRTGADREESASGLVDGGGESSVDELLTGDMGNSDAGLYYNNQREIADSVGERATFAGPRGDETTHEPVQENREEVLNDYLFDGSNSALEDGLSSFDGDLSLGGSLFGDDHWHGDGAHRFESSSSNKHSLDEYTGVLSSSESVTSFSPDGMTLGGSAVSDAGSSYLNEPSVDKPSTKDAAKRSRVA